MSIWSFKNFLYANILRESKGFVAEEYLFFNYRDTDFKG